MSFIHSQKVSKMKLPKPKTTNKEFFCQRMEDKDLEDLLEFGIIYSLGVREFKVEIEHPDTALERAITEMKRQGFSQGKINYIISRKMNKIKLCNEVNRTCRRIKA